MHSQSIDDIWDEPLAAHDDVVAPTRSKRPLFLVESDDDDNEVPASRRVAHRPPSEQEIDIDALFQEVDEDDTAEFKPLPPALDTEAIRRRAEARHKQAALSLTPHEILPSSSPPHDTGDRRGEEGKTKGKDKDGDQKKERRRPIQLNEGRLLGPSGFPQLIKDTKNFKVKGKGHEATDLNRLLQVYQFWTHSMYPKTPFRDTVERVEKLCHSRRLNVSLSVWRDEVHGIVKATTTADDDMSDDPTRNAQPSEEELDARRPTTPTFAGTSSPTQSLPPSSASELDLHDDDIETLIREESALVQENHSARTQDDDESFWSTIDDHQQPKPTLTVSQAAPMDEDHDMWDLVREIEMDSTKSQHEAPSMPQMSTTEDWDDIYV